MKRFLKLLAQSRYAKTEQPLAVNDVILLQKELIRDGHPFVPEEYLRFLQIYNGVRGVDSVLLGINTKEPELDLLQYNQAFNETKNMVILGYDDYSHLVYNSALKEYQIIDNLSEMVVEEFAENELEYALNVIFNAND